MPVGMGRRLNRLYRRSPPFLLPVGVALGLGAVFFWLFSRSLRPTLEVAASSQATNLISVAIAQEVDQHMQNDGLGYEDFVTISTDQEGAITALTGETATLNAFCRQVTEGLVARLENLDPGQLSIPLGNVTGWLLLSGLGPEIQVKVHGVGDVVVQASSSFSGAGVNQTLHQIFLDIQATVYLFIPGETFPVTVDSSVCVAETVIVGQVPQTYLPWEKGEN